MSMTGNKRGEIWLSYDEGKKRPVVIVSNNDYVAVELDFSVARVSSQNTRNQFDVEIQHWKEAGLTKPSIVRCSKINTIHHRRLLHKVGKLQPTDLDNVLSKIQEYFS